ncbi:unnamed protein product [Pieris macdunnoughi]|uniref:TIL domain-containing protein n=1 Tax=Pieris macdunnoughi TaxID=345717 RepID=A0A821TXF2_9NEOP|nr:unnamed protein product [Pieris macdunnoughi]
MLLLWFIISFGIGLHLCLEISYPCNDNELEEKFGCDRICSARSEPCTIIASDDSNKCFCALGFFRDHNGKCVLASDCSQSDTTTTTHYLMKCGLHQTYKTCEPCEKTCVEPNPVCKRICVDSNSSCEPACMTGCFCEDGYFKAPDGRCVLLGDCPKAEIMSVANEPSIEECQQDEVFVWCGWCEATCSQPSPDCPPDVCTRGCLCRPPLLRHRSGHCVEKRDCFGHTCHDRNEEYVCRYGCEPSCERRACFRQRRCSLGCHCKFGLLRDRDGKCVTADKCEINITMNNTTNTPPFV